MDFVFCVGREEALMKVSVEAMDLRVRADDSRVGGRLVLSYMPPRWPC